MNVVSQMISCPFCGKLTDPNLENCPHCGGRVQPKHMASSPMKGPAALAERQTCSNCHALVQDGDIICIACGTNLLTGQKIAGARKPVAVVAAPSRAMRWLVIGVIAAILALLVGIFFFFLLTRDPVNQAIELSRAGKELEASTVLEKYLVKHDGDPRAHFEMGKIQWRMAQYPASASSFEKTTQLQPGNTDAAWLAVIGLSQSGAGDGARDRQLAVLKHMTENDPQNARAWRFIALLKAAAGDAVGETEALKRVLEITPGDPGAMLELGVAKALQGEYAGAAKDLGSIPATTDSQAAFGFLADIQGNADEAIAQLKTASGADSAVRSDVSMRLGVLLIAQGRFEEATPVVNDASASDKNNAVAQFYRASCLRANGLLPEATGEYEALGQRTGPLAAEALVRAADLYVDQGNVAKATELLDKAEHAGAASAALHTVRGRLLAAGNQPDRALEEFRKALQIDPEYAPAHLETGLLYAKSESIHESVVSLENYIKALGGRLEGTRAAEIEMLIGHLKQASDQTGETGRASS